MKPNHKNNLGIFLDGTLGTGHTQVLRTPVTIHGKTYGSIRWIGSLKGYFLFNTEKDGNGIPASILKVDSLTDDEAREVLLHCVQQGYHDLVSCKKDFVRANREDAFYRFANSMLESIYFLTDYEK